MSFGSQSHPHSHPILDSFLFRLFSTSISATAGSLGVDILQRKVQGKLETRETYAYTDIHRCIIHHFEILRFRY
jgi:hypothetical protein